MQDDKIVVDVPVVKSLSDALGDIQDTFTPTLFTLSAGPPRHETGLVEWDDVWHRFAAYCQVIDDVIDSARDQIGALAGAVEAAAGSYQAQDQESVHVLTPLPQN